MENAQAKKTSKTSEDNWRKRIFEIIEPFKGNDVISRTYDITMLGTIAFSILPLFFKQDFFLFTIIDVICVIFFIADYVLRFITADFRLKNKTKNPFLRHPFTPMAIIDLLSILPSFIPINGSFKLLRLVRAAKLIRIAKFFRYSKSLIFIYKILKKSSHALITVGILAVSYVVIAGLIAFNAEPDQFDSLFDAMYWVVILWNFYPESFLGRIISVCSVVFGLAIVALPTSIVTAEYIQMLGRAQRASDFKKEIKAIENEIEEEVEKDIKNVSKTT